MLQTDGLHCPPGIVLGKRPGWRCIAVFSLLVGLGLGLGGCALKSQGQPDLAQSGGPGGSGNRGGERGGRPDRDQPATVEILEASPGSLDDSTTYTGSTEPRQQVSLRAQTQGQLLRLVVEPGDRLSRGDVIGQLDPSLLQSALREAEAELGVRQSEVAQAQAALGEAQAAIDRAQAERLQAQADAERLRRLAAQGAIAQQQADLARTALRVAEQEVVLAQQQFKTRQQAIAAAQQQVAAQRALVAQEQERLSFATLTAPTAGTVLTQGAEAGDFIQAGQEIITLGDLGDMQVVIELTDQDRGKVRLGQAVQIQLDAFPGLLFDGTVAQISPVAQGSSRLIPVEIRLEPLPLPAGQTLGSGLLARVNLTANSTSVVVPETTLAVSGQDIPRVFVVRDGEDRVQGRPVQLGSSRNGQVEILSGLRPGDRYIAKSDQPLRDGQAIRRSLASEF